MRILVTGAGGQLGAPTFAALKAAGHEATGTSSSGREGLLPADLFTGEGLDRALRGVDTIVHCAHTGGARDLRLARNLTAAAQRARVGHLVLISIVGIEDLPRRTTTSGWRSRRSCRPPACPSHCNGRPSAIH